MNTIAPLQAGDLIYITCPAGYVPEERVAFAKQTLEAWGYRVQSGKTIGAGEFYFSGKDEERRGDLQHALDAPEVKAILAGRGGYGCSRIIDELDFSGFLKHPKWLCGFSDLVVLHSHIHAQHQYPTLHSPMCGAFRPNSIDSFHIQSMREALQGAALRYETPPHAFNRNGEAQGLLVGGNLAILAHLSGSHSEMDTTGKILFIEDIGEHLYNIDRLLLNLKRAGKLDQLAGLVVGSFTELQDTERPFGQSVEEIIRDKVAAFDYPVLFGLPCGHAEENVTLRLGAAWTMSAQENGGLLRTKAL